MISSRLLYAYFERLILILTDNIKYAIILLENKLITKPISTWNNYFNGQLGIQELLHF